MSSTTADKINYLLDTKEEIRQAIVEKYVDVPTSATFRSYANSIRAIPTGNKTCRFVIGMSTAGWTEKDCDYLCDGVDDQVEINAAIQALPSTGGEIKVLDGTYNITAPINIDKERVTFGGCGQSTIFKRMWKGSSEHEGVIQFFDSYCNFIDFEIDGNKNIYSGGSGIVLKTNYKTGIEFKNVVSQNNNSSGIHIGGVYAQDCDFINVRCNNNSTGINVYRATRSSITASDCNNNTGMGIFAPDAENITMFSTICLDNMYGIYIPDAKNIIAIGNVPKRGKGTSSDYTSSQHTIYMSPSTTDCIIVGNICSGKAPTVAGTGNIVENNLS